MLAALGGGQSARAVKQAYRQWRMLMVFRPQARTFMQLPLNVDWFGVAGVGLNCATQQQPAVYSVSRGRLRPRAGVFSGLLLPVV